MEASMMQTVLRGTFILCLALGVLVAPGTARSQSARPAPIKLGAILSLTGAAANLGQREKESALLAVEEINAKGGVNGAPIELIIEDSKTDPNAAVSAFNKLTSRDGVIGIFGSSLGSETLAVMPLAKRLGVPMVAPNSTLIITRQNNEWVFRSVVGDPVVVTGTLKYMNDMLKVKKVAMLYQTDAYGTAGYQEFKKIHRDHGIEFVVEEKFAISDTDLSVQLTRARSANPQAIILWGTTPAPAIAMKNMKQLGIDVPVISGTSAVIQQNVDISEGTGDGKWILAGVLDATNPLPRQKPAIELHQKKLNKVPDLFNAIAYDGIMLLAKGLENAGQSPNSEKLRKGIESIKNYQGLGGVFSFSKDDHDGTGFDSIVWLTTKSGKFVPYTR
jgi:branched-chain amino acid transport system substrate-binding protein